VPHAPDRLHPLVKPTYISIFHSGLPVKRT